MIEILSFNKIPTKTSDKQFQGQLDGEVSENACIYRALKLLDHDVV